MSNFASFTISSPEEAQLVVEKTEAAATQEAERKKAEAAQARPQTNVSGTARATFQDGRQTITTNTAVSTTAREPIQPGMVRLVLDGMPMTTTLAAAKSQGLLSSVVEYSDADRASFPKGC